MADIPKTLQLKPKKDKQLYRPEQKICIFLLRGELQAPKTLDPSIPLNATGHRVLLKRYVLGNTLIFLTS